MRKLRKTLLVLQIITVAIPLIRLAADALARHYGVADDAEFEESFE